MVEDRPALPRPSPTHSRDGGEGARSLLTAVVLTWNEEANLGTCLKSLRGCVGRVIVVDSGSDDRTTVIAHEYGAHVVTHPFTTHAAQWRWAIEGGAEIATSWVLGLDADQSVTPELSTEIRTLFEDAGRLDDVAGFYVNRRQVFRGRWIRHGGYYPKYLLKLFRRDRVSFDDDDLVDHHFHVEGPTALLRHDIVEANLKENDLSFWIEKHLRYANLMAAEETRRGQLRGHHGVDGPSVADDCLERRRLARRRIWSRLPLYVRPWLYFAYRYVIRVGFLDGKEGLVFHFLHACWFRFMVDFFLDEERRAARATGGAPLRAPVVRGATSIEVSP